MAPKQLKAKPVTCIKPPALGAVVRALQEAGDTEAAQGLVRVSSPEALANTKSERREFHERRKHAEQARTGVLYISNAGLTEDEQRSRLQQVVELSKKTTTPNVFLDRWSTVTVGGRPVVAVAVDVIRYNNSVVKRFVESSANRVGYKLFEK